MINLYDLFALINVASEIILALCVLFSYNLVMGYDCFFDNLNCPVIVIDSSYNLIYSNIQFNNVFSNFI